MDNYSLLVASQLLGIKAIRLKPNNPFTWASGMKSPIYCDNRMALSYPEVRDSIVEGYINLITDKEDVDVIAGVATAGIAYGALVAKELKLPFAYIRSKAKGHGRKNVIEGQINPGDRVLIIEDLISTGMSSLKAVNAVKDIGGVVKGVLAVFSYGFKIANRNFEKAGCKVNTISDFDNLLVEARKADYLNEEEYELLKHWNTDPMKWSKDNS